MPPAQQHASLRPRLRDSTNSRTSRIGEALAKSSADFCEGSTDCLRKATVSRHGEYPQEVKSWKRVYVKAKDNWAYRFYQHPPFDEHNSLMAGASVLGAQHDHSNVPRHNMSSWESSTHKFGRKRSGGVSMVWWSSLVRHPGRIMTTEARVRVGS